MKQVATQISTQKRPESPNQLENKRQLWQRPRIQRLNLSLDTAMTSGSNTDGMFTRP
jgi:hypothetical protein